MGNIIENQRLSEGYEFETPMEAGAKVYIVIAGFLFPVMGLGLLGHELVGSWATLAGVITGGILGVAFNRLFALVAKWVSLLGLTCVVIYGALATFIS